MLSGDLGAVAGAALRDGAAGLSAFKLQVGRPLLPMLAQSATVSPPRSSAPRPPPSNGSSTARASRSTSSARTCASSPAAWTTSPRACPRWSRWRSAAGAVGRPRRRGNRAARRWSAASVSGQRQSFRQSARRRTPARTLPLTPFVFDVLHLDGEDLIDGERDALCGACPSRPRTWRVPRIVTDDSPRVQRSSATPSRAGTKAWWSSRSTSPYEAGRRGTGWIKVKQAITLDLVILAAEWGHGRRRAGSPTCTWARATPRAAGSSCSARRSKV